jgi:hypothetical protein
MGTSLSPLLYPFRCTITRPACLNRIALLDPVDPPAGCRERFLDLAAAVEKVGFEPAFVHQPDVRERSPVTDEGIERARGKGGASG